MTLQIKYTIQNMCGKIWITYDPDEAQQASRNGCYVKACGKIL